MNMDINLSAPLFQAEDIFGKSIALSSYKGKKVFIGFFRHAGCPFCNLRVHTLTKCHEELQALGLEMIFFFESKKSIMLRSTFHQEVSPIPLISDPDKNYYDAYGLESSAKKAALGHLKSFVKSAIQAKINGLPVHMMADGESISTMPAEFLLDENLIIRKLHYSQGLSDRLALDDIYAFARQQKGMTV
ncbi:peroxiredoxin Q/BCP [Catalinimonas alkaloidigena]|uniref:redoxin domain-containing protein n=1 Tax=Catalinimonas alkaloidigena TaxID=1075417 RepID=UPI002405235A|nr:redoxin domain-containing protein [Catalinimonas alkaloidigena]MDF9796658.1 peroxiredoxin Q/BCP [Catalinimonas alkaloidigena]